MRGTGKLRDAGHSVGRGSHGLTPVTIRPAQRAGNGGGESVFGELSGLRPPLRSPTLALSPVSES